MREDDEANEVINFVRAASTPSRLGRDKKEIAEFIFGEIPAAYIAVEVLSVDKILSVQKMSQTFVVGVE